MINQIKQFVIGACLLISVVAGVSPPPAYADNLKAQQVEFLLSQVRNTTGSLVSGTVTFYAAGTTTLKTVWSDRDKATPAANPYTLDANGTAQLYADGLYKVLIKNAAGTTVYTRDNLQFTPDATNNDYYPDPSAADQGATTNSRSIASLLAAIGTSKQATIVLAHSGSGNTTTYTIGQNVNWSAYTNVTFKIVPGAVISHGAFTVNIPNPDAGLYQIFSGTGAVTISGSVKEVYPQWFGAVADAVFTPATNVCTGTDNYAAFASAIAAAGKNKLKIPYGEYRVVAPAGGGLTLPDGFNIEYNSATSYIYFDDTAAAGSYLFSNGVADVGGGYGKMKGMRIKLLTATAKGIYLLNSKYSVFRDTYIEGYIPLSPYTGISSRSNVGIYITSSAATDSFFNTFDNLELSHVHEGVICPSGDITNTQFFYNVRMYGDALYGDTASSGFVIAGCSNSIVNGGYFESYDNGVAAAFNLSGPRATGWKVRDIVFDQATGIAMNAIRISDVSGYPSLNSFTGCTFTAGTGYIDVVDGSSAIHNNYIEGNPSQVAQTATVTMTAGTSGTITLVSGASGDLVYAQKVGRMVKVWGELVADSVSSPVGALNIVLPSSDAYGTRQFFYAATPSSTFGSGSISATELEATAVTSLQISPVSGNPKLVIQRFEAGVAQTDTASKIKAGSVISFYIEYPTTQPW